MTSSLSSTSACCKSSNSPVASPTSLSRRKLLLFSATATSGLVILAPASQGNPFAAARPYPSTSTPYSQSQQFGLDANGRIRPCPSTNPGCVSTNPTVGAACSVASPLLIPPLVRDKAAAAAALRQAILKTQRNAVIKADDKTAYGHYIQAEVDGGLTGGRDVMEFLIKAQQQEEGSLVAAYRCVATRITFIYPFTTAVGNSKGQSQRIAAVCEELGWYAPDLLLDVTDEE